MILELLSSQLKEQFVEAYTKIVEQDKTANRIYFIKKGCLRQVVLKDGVEITLQFFTEGDYVSSAESFKNNEPSQFFIESIEQCDLLYIHKSAFRKLVEQNPAVKDKLYDHVFKQFIHFQNLFLSRIMYTPKKGIITY